MRARWQAIHLRRPRRARRAFSISPVLVLVLIWILLTSATAGGSSRTDGGTAAERPPVGCTSASDRVVSEGPSSRREVALTFDDGPSITHTPKILAILGALDAHATFFEEGRHVRGRGWLMREILAAGDEIGNHTYHHPHYPGADELASTDRRIRGATGFRPCLFRPPYGLIDGRVRSAVARCGGLETVLWSIDSGDDHHAGAARITAHVVSAARPGSIVLMHDGGRHPQTVRALTAVIEGLRARGLRMVTVSALLGGRLIYPKAGTAQGNHPM